MAKSLVPLINTSSHILRKNSYEVAFWGEEEEEDGEKAEGCHRRWEKSYYIFFLAAKLCLAELPSPGSQWYCYCTGSIIISYNTGHVYSLKIYTFLSVHKIAKKRKEYKNAHRASNFHSNSKINTGPDFSKILGFCQLACFQGNLCKK